MHALTSRAALGPDKLKRALVISHVQGRGLPALSAATTAQAARLKAALKALNPSQQWQFSALLLLGFQAEGCLLEPPQEGEGADHPLQADHDDLLFIVEPHHVRFKERPKAQPQNYAQLLYATLSELPEDSAIERVLQHVLIVMGGGIPLRDWERQHGGQRPQSQAAWLGLLASALQQWASFGLAGAWVSAGWGPCWAGCPVLSRADAKVLHLGVTTPSYPQFYPVMTPGGKRYRFPGDAKELTGLGYQLGGGKYEDVPGPGNALQPGTRVPLDHFMSQLHQADVLSVFNAANDLPCIACELLKQFRVRDALSLVAKPVRCSRSMTRHTFPTLRSAQLSELCDLLTAVRVAEAQAQGQEQGPALIKRPSSSAKHPDRERADAVRALRQCDDELLRMALAGRTSAVTKAEAKQVHSQAKAADRAAAVAAKAAAAAAAVAAEAKQAAEAAAKAAEAAAKAMERAFKAAQAADTKAAEAAAKGAEEAAREARAALKPRRRPAARRKRTTESEA